MLATVIGRGDELGGNGGNGLRLRLQELLRRGDSNKVQVDERGLALRLRERQLAARQIARGDIVARIDLQQHVAGAHKLVVGDREVGHHALDLRGDGDGAAINKCVVGAFEITRGIPVPAAADQRRPAPPRPAR